MLFLGQTFVDTHILCGITYSEIISASTEQSIRVGISLPTLIDAVSMIGYGCMQSNTS